MAELLAIALLGAAVGAAYLPGSPVAWLPWFGLAPLLFAAWRAGPARAFRLGWVWGTAGWLVGMHWLAPTTALFLGVPAPVAFLLYFAACLAVGTGFGVLAALAACAPPSKGLWSAWLTAVGAAATVDRWYPEFWPWSLGVGQVAYPVLAQTAAFGGPAALSCLIAAVNAGFAAAAAGEGDTRARPLLASLAALFLAAGAGALRLAQVDASAKGPPSLRVTLVQGELPPRLREPESNIGDLPGYAAQTAAALAAAPADLVVWPESAFPGRVTLEPSGAWVGELPFGAVLGAALPPGPPVLLGAITERGPVGGRQRRYNTALYADGDRNLVGWVDKAYLIPFGEFMPFGRVGRALRRFSPGTWSLGRGRGPGVLAGPGDAVLGVPICYEDLIPARSRGMVLAGADVLIDVTNAAWFTPAARESHFLFSRMRAVETGLPSLVAANGGVTAFVDAAGRVSARLPEGRAGTLAVTVPTGRVPAPGLKVWRLFDWLGALALVLGLLVPGVRKFGS
ncbi:apolipoprotein N-acyltransferase [bacterium]|nr:MAG: apolipoprotein N-acyltransferase [bacterium]